MVLSYDIFAKDFLDKVNEFNFIRLDNLGKTSIAEDMIDGYLRRSLTKFRRVCRNVVEAMNDEERIIEVNITENESMDLIDLISEGMLEQWMKPFVYNQENLENVLNTKDFSTYSPAELIRNISNSYTKIQKDYTNMIREYSYCHGDLSDLHL